MEILQTPNYGLNQECETDISEFLHNNYDKIEIDEQRRLVCRCLTDNQIKSILLRHELTRFRDEPVEQMSLFDFAKAALDLFKKYHWKAGGFRYEDDVWTLYTPPCLDYDLEENQILFENTIDVSDVFSDETVEYNESILAKLNSLAKNINVELNTDKGHKTTIVVTITAEDISQKDDNPIIGL